MQVELVMLMLDATKVDKRNSAVKVLVECATEALLLRDASLEEQELMRRMMRKLLLLRKLLKKHSGMLECMPPLCKLAMPVELMLQM